MDFVNKKVLITGGGSGIGKALIEELIEKGVNHFAVVGRRIAPIEALKQEFPHIHFLPIQADVSKPDECRSIAQQVQSEWGNLDFLINNAGVVSAGFLEDISDEDIIQQININVTGLILLTKYCLPLLKESKEAAIINVSSGLGYIAMPFYSVYAATKAAVRQFSDALRRELHGYNIRVITAYPTATDTDMMKSAKVGKMDTPKEVAQGTIEGLIKGEINVIFGGDQRLKEIDLNFNNPKEMDAKAAERFEAMKERTATHRAM